MLLVMDLKSFLTYSITHILAYYSYPVFFSFVPFGSEEKKENERKVETESFFSPSKYLRGKAIKLKEKE